MTKKTPEGEKGRGFKSVKNLEVKKASPQNQHAIEMHYVGLPGQETLVASTSRGDQLGVRRFDRGSILDVKRAAAEQTEHDALADMKGREVAEQSSIAREALESSHFEAQDIQTLTELMEEREDLMLFVDKETIDDSAIPKEGLHLLITKAEVEKLRPHLEELGYFSEDIAGTCLKAEKGKSRLIFIYAQERSEAEKAA